MSVLLAAAAFSFSHIGDGKWLRMVIPPEKQDWATRGTTREQRPLNDSFGISFLMSVMGSVRLDPIWDLPVSDSLTIPATPLSYDEILVDVRESMQSTLQHTLRPEVSKSVRFDTIFEIPHWPIYSLDTVGFNFKTKDGEIMWANIGIDYLVLYQPTTPAVSLNEKAICQYAETSATKLLMFRGAIEKSVIKGQRFGTNLWLGSIVFPKKSKEIHWDDQFLFCTDGAKIAFVFGKDRELSLPPAKN